MRWRARLSLRRKSPWPNRKRLETGFHLGLVLWLAATLLAIVSGKSYAAPLVALACWLAACALLTGRFGIRGR